jgi:hypothetical protein
LEHEPEGLLNAAAATIDRFLCQALRGEPAPWSALEPLVPDAEFVERSRHHGVQALLFCLMKSRPEWHDWPVVVRGALEQSHKALVAQDLMRQHYLATLVGALADRGVRCLLTKGEALARTLYATPGTRSRSDSDLFIPVAAIEDVRRSVVGLGYRIVSPVYKSRQFTVMRPGSTSGDVRFDIHWRILNAPRYARVLSFEEAHGRSAVVPGLQNARMLCHQDALLLACMHRFGNARHDRNRLIWICDVDALVGAMGERGLLQFASIAVEKEVQVECLDGLRRAEQCFGTVVPESVKARLESPRPPASWARKLARSQPGLLIADWCELPGAAARSRLAKELFFPSARTLLARYGKYNRLWLPVLYVRRLLDGLFGRMTTGQE